MLRATAFSGCRGWDCPVLLSRPCNTNFVLIEIRLPPRYLSARPNPSHEAWSCRTAY